MEHEPVKIADIALAMPEENIHNVRKDVKYLKSENLIGQVGNGRATIYYAKK